MHAMYLIKERLPSLKDYEKFHLGEDVVWNCVSNGICKGIDNCFFGIKLFF
jgi:hypothetical protein